MKTLRKVLRRLNVFGFVRRLAFLLANWRRGRFKDLDYVVLTLPQKLPPFPEERNLIRRRIQGEPPMSLLELQRTLERIADDPRPEGLVIYMRGLAMSLADLQTLREMLAKLRRRGKRVVCFAHGYDTRSYFVASAADDIVLQEGGTLDTVGMRTGMTFIRDALDAIGMQVDAVAISPFKGAADRLTRSDISPEGREQLNWLLDSEFEMLVQGIAEGRGITEDEARAMIDGAPYLDSEALEGGHVDAVLTEEGLPGYLKARHFVTWNKALKVLHKPWRSVHEKYVAVLPVAGTIIEGESGKPPSEVPIPIVGEERMGSITVVQQVRNVMKDERAAALVLYIDSGGGSASASEAMASALDELAKKRPVVVFMNSVAASGGYYIATPAHWIVARPGTITGSIGVLSAKLVNAPMLRKLRFNPLEFTRGANAGLSSGSAPFSDAERAVMRRQIERIYTQFTGRVARSRKMSVKSVDEVGGGRVWTGAQALRHGLVDELGGLDAALAKARAMAGLPDDAPMMVVKSKGKPLGPQLAEQTNPAASLLYVNDGLEQLFNGRAQLLLPLIWR